MSDLTYQPLIIEFDDVMEKMFIHEFHDDGTQQIYTELTLQQMKNAGNDYTVPQIGKNLLMQNIVQN